MNEPNDTVDTADTAPNKKTDTNASSPSDLSDKITEPVSTSTSTSSPAPLDPNDIIDEDHPVNFIPFDSKDGTPIVVTSKEQLNQLIMRDAEIFMLRGPSIMNMLRKHMGLPPEDIATND